MGAKQVIVQMLIFLYFVCGAGMLYLIDNNCGDKHATFSLVSTLMVGAAALIFRALPTLPTRLVKYIHLCIHIGAFAMMIVGFTFMRYATGTDAMIHPIPGWVIIGVLVFQFLLGLFIFIYLYDDQRRRVNFSPFHDIFGIWIFICLVGCVLSGFRMTDSDIVDPMENIKRKIFTILAYCGFIIVAFVLLAPFLEWERVGRI